MTEWLAHPSEFGVRPKTVRHKRTYQASLIHGDAEIHLCEYVMPDGTCGRGFVNGSLTWSFLGEGVEAIDDDNLLPAYCGWGSANSLTLADAQRGWGRMNREMEIWIAWLVGCCYGGLVRWMAIVQIP